MLANFEFRIKAPPAHPRSECFLKQGSRERVKRRSEDGSGGGVRVAGTCVQRTLLPPFPEINISTIFFFI